MGKVRYDRINEERRPASFFKGRVDQCRVKVRRDHFAAAACRNARIVAGVRSEIEHAANVVVFEQGFKRLLLAGPGGAWPEIAIGGEVVDPAFACRIAGQGRDLGVQTL